MKPIILDSRYPLAPYWLVAAVSFCLVSSVNGQVIYNWTNTSNTFSHYDISSNWSPTGGPPLPSDIAIFLDPARSYGVWWDGLTGSRNLQQLGVLNGDVTFLNVGPTSQWELTVNGSGGGGAVTDLTIDGGDTVLNVVGIHLRSLGGARLTRGGSLFVDGSPTIGSTFTVDGSVGFQVDGYLDVRSGGVVSSTNSAIARDVGRTGIAWVDGVGSRWDNSSSLSVGYEGTGFLVVKNGGVVTNTSAIVGWLGGVFDVGQGAVVDGAGSQWNSSSSLTLGQLGFGRLDISNGGVATASDLFLAVSNGSQGRLAVSGVGSQFNSLGSLSVGSGTGIVSISNGGLVSVLGTTTIGGGTVNLSWGRFEFGQTNYSDFNKINAIAGSMAGDVSLSGYNSIGSLGAFQNPGVDLTDVRAVNSGVLEGTGVLGVGLHNRSTGELRATAGQWARVSGFNNVNQGEINNYGGTVEFESELTNEAGGFIAGRGQFMAHGGWTNSGTVALSAGISDFIGDFENLAGGTVVTSGGAVTTFFDDVVHNGSEIRTSAGSSTVFFGELSGAGPFTGSGDVFVEGDLRPGNSPDIVLFGGNLFLGTNSTFSIEIAGTQLGEFDRLEIDGDFSLDGGLFVSLIDGFQLGANQRFLIADIEGAATGMFNGLDEGSLVGNFGGRDLFISYAAGNGNDVVLFSPVPEPVAGLMFTPFIVSIVLRRNRKERNHV